MRALLQINIVTWCIGRSAVPLVLLSLIHSDLLGQGLCPVSKEACMYTHALMFARAANYLVLETFHPGTTILFVFFAHGSRKLKSAFRA
jgi:hypothetical protein